MTGRTHRKPITTISQMTAMTWLRTSYLMQDAPANLANCDSHIWRAGIGIQATVNKARRTSKQHTGDSKQS